VAVAMFNTIEDDLCGKVSCDQIV